MVTQAQHLRDIFHKPATKEIAGVDFQIYKLGLDQFGPAIEFGDWIGEDAFSFERLKEAAKPGAPQRALLLELVGGCLKLPDSEEFLQAEGAAQMPAVMLIEAVAVILEENADFFIQTLPKLAQAVSRLLSIGGELFSSLSVQATTANASDATP